MPGLTAPLESTGGAPCVAVEGGVKLEHCCTTKPSEQKVREAHLAVMLAWTWLTFSCCRPWASCCLIWVSTFDSGVTDAGVTLSTSIT